MGFFSPLSNVITETFKFGALEGEFNNHFSGIFFFWDLEKEKCYEDNVDLAHEVSKWSGSSIRKRLGGTHVKFWQRI